MTNKFDDQALLEEGIVRKQVVGHVEVYQKDMKIKDTRLISEQNYSFAPTEPTDASNDSGTDQ